MTQLDLFDWADSRPTAEIIDWIPHLGKRMWAERHKEIEAHEAKIMPLPARPIERKRA